MTDPEPNTALADKASASIRDMQTWARRRLRSFLPRAIERLRELANDPSVDPKIRSGAEMTLKRYGLSPLVKK